MRRLGSKLTIALGLALVSGGLVQVAGASTTTTYTETVLGMTMLGVGAGLVFPAGVGAVMGQLPRAHTGVGSGTNGSFVQIGGALGVAVVGSLLSTRYQHRMSSFLAPFDVPHGVEHAILGAFGTALAVSRELGGVSGRLLATAARSAFISGMDLGLHVAAIVALGGCLLALLALPSRGADRSRQNERR